MLARTAIALGSLALALLASSLAGAAELDMPVPDAVVYPGKEIAAGGLSTRTFIVKDDKIGLFVADPSELVGHVARRTLLPGKAIRRADLTRPDAVKAGTPVQLVYRDGGLVITGMGLALQSGQEGETIRVRNSDSGITVSGRIALDGSVTIEG